MPAETTSPPAPPQSATPDPAQQRPARNIILLSDGTGNSRGKSEQTNVWRVYEALDLADPPHPLTPRQFAFYDDGVGTSSFKPLALLGGAVGFGLARNVRDLYAFLCRMYLPGDRIYAFGFSRGAFTVRVLAGLICNQGVVPYHGDEGELDRLVNAAFRAYRRRYKLWLHWIGPVRALRDALIAAWARARGKLPYDRIAPANHKPDIAFIGVWDTVAAYGVPVDEFGIFIDKFVWPFQMPDAVLNQKVKHAVHALSLDDERNTFHPKPWDFEAGERIRQVWFAGMHSDVGGGYADKGLSHVSLKWVTDAAAACELRFVPATLAAQHALSDENGPMNDSRHGLAGYYRYNPRRLDVLLKPHGIARPTVHESVLRRIRAGQDAYAPIVLPAGFEVQLLGGAVVDGARYLAGEQAGDGDVAKPPPALATAVATAPIAASTGHGDYAAQRERIYNLVWFKRVVYFATLFATLLLLALPLVGSTKADACTSGAWCWFSPFIRALDAVVPAGLDRWTRWYALQPEVFVPLLAAVLLGLAAGGGLQRAIFDAMRRVWYAIDSLRPSTVAAAPLQRPIGGFSRALAGLRTSTNYQRLLNVIRRVVLPGVFGGLMVFGLAAVVFGVWFNVAASSGALCVESQNPRPVLETPETLTLDTRELCQGSDLRLERGGTYELVLTAVPRGERLPVWADGADGADPIAADLRGVGPAGRRLWPWTPFRRELAQPWLQPMARIGGKGGDDVTALLPEPSLPLQQPLPTLRTTLVARSSGELFLYVNDAVGPPWDFAKFQRNNAGTAVGTIRLVRPPQAAASAAAR